MEQPGSTALVMYLIRYQRGGICHLQLHTGEMKVRIAFPKGHWQSWAESPTERCSPMEMSLPWSAHRERLEGWGLHCGTSLRARTCLGGG